MKIELSLSGWPFAGGGVEGRKKARIPSSNDAPPARVKMFRLVDHPRKPMMRPATIHPIVPQTRRAGNLL